MDIAILGAGRVGTTLATGLHHAGHRITVGARNGCVPANWAGPPLPFATLADAIEGALVVVNATPGNTSVDMLAPLRVLLAGRLLVDVANATGRGGHDMPGDLLYPGSSLAEQLARALPETKVVKTLNTMLFSVMTNPGALTAPPTAFLSGDDAAAKQLVAGLLSDLGWSPEHIEDLGGVATARGPEAFMPMVASIIRNRGFAPFALAIAR